MEKCAYDKWVETVAKLLIEQRHGAGLMILIHNRPDPNLPGNVEMMVNDPDAMFAVGLLRTATLAIEDQVRSRMGMSTETIRNKDLAEILEREKLKVN